MTTNNAYDTMTFAEVVKLLAPDKSSILNVADVLSEENPIVDHATWVESNDLWSHREARQLSEPTPTWRKVNSGVGIGAGRTIPVTSTIGLCEIYSEIDVEIINSFGDKKKQARITAIRPFLKGMKKELVATMLYGSTATTPEEFNGFMTFMGSLATTTNVLNAGGSGSDVTSILIVMWGLDQVFMVYPKGTPAGIKHEDLGIATVSSSTTAIANAAQYQAYRDHFVMRAGLMVKDDRCIGRIANIEVTGAVNIFDEDDLITVLNRMPSGAKWIYANGEVITQMQIAAKDKNNINYTLAGGDGLSGGAIVNFNTYPVFKLDQLLKTETAIS